MPITWILVANDGGGRIYETDSIEKGFKPIQQFSHPKGRKKDAELGSDRPGRSFDSSGHQRHSMGEEVSPHVHEEEVFIRELIEFLENNLNKKKFDQLALVAPPHFLGELRKALPGGLKNCIKAELHKDFPTYMKDEEVFEHLSAGLKL